MIDKNLRKEEEKRKWNIENKQAEQSAPLTPQAQSAGLNYAAQLTQSSGGGSNAMSGALSGAAAGTMIAPGIGTVVGAGVGGLAGGLQAMADKKRRKQEIQAQVQMQLAGIEQGKADRIANAMQSLQNSFAQSLSNRGNVRL